MCGHLLGCQFRSGLLGVKDRVAEPLRESIDGLSSAKEVEANSPLIEGALRALSRAIQFLTEPIEEWHWRVLRRVILKERSD